MTDSRRGAGSFQPSRRSFLKFLGGAAAAGLVPEFLEGCAMEPAPSLGSVIEGVGAVTGIPLGTPFTITRPRDGLALTFTPLNLAVDAAGKNLTRVDATKPTYLIATFGSLHLDEVSTDWYVGVVPHRAAGPSRLVFRLPDATAIVPLKLTQLLALCKSSSLNVAANAISDSSATLNSAAWRAANLLGVPVPDPTVTAIEAPYRLILSPNELARFAHATAPVVSSSGRVELWSTRLGVSDAAGNVDERAATNRTMRAIYMRDPQDDRLNQYGEGYETLGYLNRKAIVAQSGSFASTTSVPPSLTVDNFVLTPIGATLDVSGRWDNSPSLVSWKHRALLGRDQYVQTTLIGYLLPFGLAAVSVQTTRRGVHSSVARLWSEWQIHLLDTVHEAGTMTANGLPPVANRRFPFRRVTVKGPTTYDFDMPAGGDTTYVEAVKDGKAIQLHLEALDWKGNKITLRAPLVWAQKSTLPAGIQRYNGYANGGLSTVDLGRQRIAVAPSKTDTTTIEAAWMQMNVENAGTAAAPIVNPTVRVFGGALEIMRHAAGEQGATGASDTYFTYHSDYSAPPTMVMSSMVVAPPLVDGAPSQRVLGIAKDIVSLASASVPLAFASNGGRGGGIIQPNASIAGLTLGTGASADLPSGRFDPSTYFADVGKIFGLIKLTDLVPASTIASAPQIVTEALHAGERYYAEAKQLANALKSLPADVQAELNAQVTAANAVVNGVKITDANAFFAGAVADLEIVLHDPLHPPQDFTTTLARTWTPMPAVLTAIQTALNNATLSVSGARRAVLSQLQKLQLAMQGGLSAITQAISLVQAGTDVFRDLKAKLEWRPSISLDKPAGDGSYYRDVADGLLTLKQQDPLYLSVQLDGKSNSADGGITIFASLDHFYLNFPPRPENARVQLQFDRIFFSKAPGAKPEIDVNFKDIQFAKELSFIQDIRKLIPLDGFSDPPHVDVDETGIHASFSLGLPNLAFGVLSFENLKLSAALDVPFLGEITFRFSFCDRDHPFTVTVAMLGGGGYFMLEMATDPGGGTGSAFRRLEASIDVCAQVSINLGLASGSVSISAGIRFTYDKATGAHLTGFVDVRGAVDVLGLVNISVEAKLELTYDFQENALVGSCTLTVDVEVAFFSKSVSLTFEKRFGGSGASAPPITNDMRMLMQPMEAQTVPSFADLMPRSYVEASPNGTTTHTQPWINEYLAAFG